MDVSICCAHVHGLFQCQISVCASSHTNNHKLSPIPTITCTTDPTTVTNANEYEFSIFVTFGTGSARNVAIYCRVDTFPPPTISWSLKDRSDSSGTVISRVNNTHIRFGAVESVESSSNVGPNISYEMALTIDDALYSDAGIYHCIADNEVINTETDIVRLRVKGMGLIMT